MQTINQSDKNITIFDNIQWSNPVESLDSTSIDDLEYWERSDISPEEGQIRFIFPQYRYDQNFRVDRDYYFLFQPAWSSIEGYDEEYPDDIEKSFIVNATIKNQDVRGSESWCAISINRAIRLRDWQFLVKEQIIRPDLFDLQSFECKSYTAYFRYKYWLNIYLYLNQECMVHFIFYDRENELTLVYCYADYCSNERAIITNYKLNDEEHKVIALALNGDRIVMPNSRIKKDSYPGGIFSRDIKEITSQICNGIKSLIQ